MLGEHAHKNVSSLEGKTCTVHIKLRIKQSKHELECVCEVWSQFSMLPMRRRLTPVNPSSVAVVFSHPTLTIGKCFAFTSTKQCRARLMSHKLTLTRHWFKWVESEMSRTKTSGSRVESELSILDVLLRMNLKFLNLNLKSMNFLASFSRHSKIRTFLMICWMSCDAIRALRNHYHRNCNIHYKWNRWKNCYTFVIIF